MGPDRSTFSFPQAHRVRKRREYLRVQRRGERIWGRRFIFYFGRPGTGEARLGITVSRKVGNAVTRNRIKRWVREAFRQNREIFNRPVDLVLIAKRDIEDFSYANIEAELVEVVRRFHREGGRRGGRSRQKRGQR